MSFDIDASVAASSADMNAAADQDKVEAIQNGDKIGATKGDDMPVKDWMGNLPKNVGVGIMDAASNTVDAAKVFGESTWNNLFRPSPAQRAVNEAQGKTADGATMEDLREKFLAQPMVQETHGPIRQAYQAFRDELASGSTTSDEITQGIAQFAVPMLGWSKLLGVQKAISAGGFLAEGITASSALAPHAGRNADLVQQGKAIEGKLGDALNTIAPDGSALNAYINYMTDRSGESDAEGRFKNVIDSMVTTTAGAALLKTGATALKVGMNLPGYIADTAGTGPLAGSPDAQAGKIVFHGTPHDFDTFDSSKIGTGEGNQTYGHGLYFAEDAVTAGTYQKKLTVGKNPDLSAAVQQVATFNGSKQKAYTSLMLQADNAQDPNTASTLRRQASFIRSGAVDKSGNLMHVDIPDEVIGKMWDYDKPFSAQTPEVQKAAEQVWGQIPPDKASSMFLKTPDETVSKAMHEAGMTGVKYLDQGSRNAGTGTRNLVLFDAKHAKIVKKD